MYPATAHLELPGAAAHSENEWVQVFRWISRNTPLYSQFALDPRYMELPGEDYHGFRALAERLVYFGAFQLAVALVILLPARLERLRPLEPMRFLHLVYLLFVLLSGGLLGQYVLKKSALRWLVLFVPLSAGMFYAQRQMYPATAHLELPSAASRNNWIEAFRWISRNTPVDSQFALDPRYMELPGEDYHGFRALAERSVLVDEVKDGGMAARVPSLAPRWLREVEAQRGWRSFQRLDFLHLKAEFGVNWVVLTAPGVEGLPCPYRNPQVVVCRVE